MRCLLNYALVFSLLGSSAPGWGATAPSAAGQKVSGRAFSSDPKVPLGLVRIRVSTFPEPAIIGSDFFELTLIESDLFGHFEMDLPPGTWILHASAEGFADLNEKINLQPGKDAHPALRLQPLEYEAEVFVVHGHANRPPEEMMRRLNAPMQPPPTEFEKKIAPVVYVFKIAMIVTIWTLIALGGTHK